MIPDPETADRLLDAAGALFAAHGVAAVGMGDIAAAAGCSRATVYRYFENRHVLRAAFVHREARRLGAAVASKVARIDDPAKRLEAAVVAAIAGVRSDPLLSAWFSEDSQAIAGGLAVASEVIEALAASFLGGAADRRTRDAAGFVVRFVVSVLAVPGRDLAEERRLVRRFVVPAVLA